MLGFLRGKVFVLYCSLSSSSSSLKTQNARGPGALAGSALLRSRLNECAREGRDLFSCAFSFGFQINFRKNLRGSICFFLLCV